jgi:nanoRNase/pAp phosphatase (c-di-AMP/oligoRNAs hydrolase)
VQGTSGDHERGSTSYAAPQTRQAPPFKRRKVAVIDHWENDAVVGTNVTAPEAFATIRQLGQKTRDGQWRYTLRRVKRETANS